MADTAGKSEQSPFTIRAGKRAVQSYEDNKTRQPKPKPQPPPPYSAADAKKVHDLITSLGISRAQVSCNRRSN